MFEDVHHQLARVGVGEAQFVAAVCQYLASLLRVPLFFCHPAGALRGEDEFCGVRGLAAEDAVAGGEMCVQFFFGDVFGFLAFRQEF